MALKLTHITVWDDTGYARSGGENMAIDEKMFDRFSEGAGAVPLLRFYKWDGDWWSVGYFQREEMRGLEMRGHRVVRRRTGGGVVSHDAGEETYSLIMPVGCVLGGMAVPDLYRAVHEALAAAICDAGGAAGLAEAGGGGEPGRCFDQPVADDVIEPGSGKKLAGAALRRSRTAVLHQGSVRLAPELRGRWQPFFIERLSEESEVSYRRPSF